MSATTGDLRLTEPIKGPSALGTDRTRFLRLTWTLAVTTFKLRFYGSALGYLWQLMRPLMLFAVLYAVFSQIVVVPDEIKYFPAALLLGIVIFMFFSEATSGSLTSLLLRENLVRKIDFPRLAVPLAVIMTALFNFALALIPAFGFLFAAGGGIRATWIQLPFLVLGLVILATGVGMILAPLFVRYRDVNPIWEVALQLMFYASPIIYPIQLLAERNETLAQAILYNPLAALIQQARYALVDPSHPSAAEAIGGGARLLVPIGITVVLFAVGYWLFNREAPRIAEQL